MTVNFLNILKVITNQHQNGYYPNFFKWQTKCINRKWIKIWKINN